MVNKTSPQLRYSIFLVLVACLVVGVLPTVSAFNWTDNLDLYYDFESATEKVSGTYNLIAGEGTMNYTSNGALIGKSGRFTENNNLKILANNGFDLDDGDHTLNYWAYKDNADTVYYMGRAKTDYVLAFHETNQLYCRNIVTGTCWETGLTGVKTATWVMLTVVHNGTSASIYINGSLVQTSVSALAIDDSDVWTLGTSWTNTSDLVGYMDEMGFWSRALTPAEITQLYNNGDGLPMVIIMNNIAITLESPLNKTTISDVGANFTSSFNITGTKANNYTWKNATYYVWKNGDLFNTTTVSLSGNSTNYTQNIDSFTLADYKWNVLGYYGNDTYSNYTWSSNGNFTFTVGASIDVETYDNETYETADNTFEVNMTLLSGVVLQAAYLYYDDVRYIGTVTSLGSNKYSMIKTLDVPLISSSENKAFHWSFVYTSPVQKTQNTTSQNQTVNPIFLGLCNATYTTHALDIDIKEEGTFDDLDGTLEFSADYWLGDGTVKKEFTFSYLENDTNDYDFCISPTDRTFYIDDIISYTATNYERRDYFLTNAELSNATMNLSLYLAATTTTDIFTVTVQDENSNPVEGAFINVQRWDIGTNNFYTIGVIKTTSDGTGIINMRLNDAWYRFQVNYEDKLYLTTEPRKESGTSRILNINLVTANPYKEFENIDYSLTYSEDTNVTSFTYSDTTGAVATGCLRVLKLEGDGNTEVYYSCVSSSSGTLSYEIEDDGTYIIRAIFRLTSEYDSVEQVVDEIIRQGTSERFTIIGKFGQVISLLLIGTSATLGVAIGSIPLGLGLIAVSLVLVNLMGWLNITGSVLYGLISIIILIAINLRRGR